MSIFLKFNMMPAYHFSSGLPEHHRSAEMADMVLVLKLLIDIWHCRVSVRVRVKIYGDL